MIFSVLVGGALVLLYLLTRPTDQQPPGTSPAAAPTPLTIASATAFDPQGSGQSGENDDDAPKAADGDPRTQWTTEGYKQRDFGTKQGVGIVFTLAHSAALNRVDIESPTRGWSASLYVLDAAGLPASVPPRPTAAVSGVEGDAQIALPDGATGRSVLLWITDLGDGPPPFRFRLDEASIVGTSDG
jgi:hypothetical protein